MTEEFSRTNPIIPREYAGKWIAWNRTLEKIIASGDSREAVEREAKATGEEKPILRRVPKGDALHIGGFRG